MEVKNTQALALRRRVRSEVLSSAAFLRLKRENPGLIVRSHFIPPDLRVRDDFGKVWVEYRRPQFRQVKNLSDFLNLRQGRERRRI